MYSAASSAGVMVSRDTHFEHNQSTSHHRPVAPREMTAPPGRWGPKASQTSQGEVKDLGIIMRMLLRGGGGFDVVEAGDDKLLGTVDFPLPAGVTFILGGVWFRGLLTPTGEAEAQALPIERLKFV